MKNYIALITGLIISFNASAQFIDNFDKPADGKLGGTPAGWGFNSGDGTSSMRFVQEDGYASIYVDATTDLEGIWWALIVRRDIPVDEKKLMQPGYELRAEAKIRVSSAPKRVNLHFNTQRTTDFHSNLMEYDIPDTTNWHVISFTTTNWDAKPGDKVNGQMALMDWGLKKYRVDIDYYKVDVVKKSEAGKDLGAEIPYRPPIPDLGTFHHNVQVSQDAMIDLQYKDMNFNSWESGETGSAVNLLTVTGSQYIIMRWDLSAFKGMKVGRSGVMELTVYDLQRSPEYQKDFGQMRITEILGGDQAWDQKTVTYNSLCQGEPIDEVLNSQMTIDTEIPEVRGNKVIFTISWPVLQRMLDGKTLGIAIKPLGSVVASFYSMENNGGEYGPRLYFDLDKDMK